MLIRLFPVVILAPIAQKRGFQTYFIPRRIVVEKFLISSAVVQTRPARRRQATLLYAHLYLVLPILNQLLII